MSFTCAKVSDRGRGDLPSICLGALFSHTLVSTIRMAQVTTSARAHATPRQASTSLAMAPHLSLAELDLIAMAVGEQGRRVTIDEIVACWACEIRVPKSETVGVKQPRSSPDYAPYKLYKPGYKPAYKLL